MSWGDPDPYEAGQAEAPTMAARDPLAPGLALLMGAGSILMGYLPLAHFAFFVHYYLFLYDLTAPTGDSWRTLVFSATRPWPVTIALGWLTVAWALGYAGWRIARAPGRRDSLASAAARLSALGLIGCGLDLAILAGMLAYRLARHFFG